MAAGLIVLTACKESEGEMFDKLSNMRAENVFRPSTQLALIKAVDTKNQDALIAAIEKGADIDAPGSGSITPLFWVLIKRNPEGLTLLLEQGADPNKMIMLPEDFQEKSTSAMDVASRMDDSQYLKILLEHGGNPNLHVNDWNEPVLHRAIMYRQLDNVKLLVEHGADINHQDKSGTTPLMQAVLGTMYEIALYLLKQGSDPNLSNKHGVNAVALVERFGEGGINKESNDLAAYREFIEELKERGLIKEN